MDNLRLFLFFALAMVLMLIWQAWEQYNAPPPAPAAPSAGPAEPSVPAPPSSAPAQAPTPQPSAEKLASTARVRVRTDLFEATLDTQGADLRELRLRKYPVDVDSPDKPFALMADSGPELFIAQSGLIGHGTDYPTHKLVYQSSASEYALAPEASELRVPLTWRAANGVVYTKTYVFRRNSYVVDVEFAIANGSRSDWTGYLYGQFQRSHVDTSSMFRTPTYTGGAIHTPENHFEKISFDDMRKRALKREVKGGWVGMLQHYFVGAWLQPAQARNEFYTDVLGGERNVIGFKRLDPVTVAPGATGAAQAKLYLGPKERTRLTQLSCGSDITTKDAPACPEPRPYGEGMDLTVDYGWLTPIAAPLFWLLNTIHRAVGNWGWAIILLTILIKLAFYPLSAASYKSMAHMKKLQPRMQALRERYGDDRQKLNQAMMELYKTEKINPLGGCLPILIQIPVFIALYWVLLESVEMRQAPWILWIRDLSAKDPYYVLPIIMGASTFMQQRLNPTPMDPIQQKVFMFLPWVFTVFFLFFPAGLVLYWVVNNILSIAQQWAINRTIGVAKK
jgi:YidC/Oxa1 family membrane protein insertase